MTETLHGTTSGKRTLALVGMAVVAALAIVMGLSSVSNADGATTTPKAPQATTTPKAPQAATTQAQADAMLLRSVLPYYRVDAPGWCEEDMSCWAGSTADGRTNAALVKALRCDIARGSWAYSEQTAPRGALLTKCGA